MVAPRSAPPPPSGFAGHLPLGGGGAPPRDVATRPLLLVALLLTLPHAFVASNGASWVIGLVGVAGMLCMGALPLRSSVEAAAFTLVLAGFAGWNTLANPPVLLGAGGPFITAFVLAVIWAGPLTALTALPRRSR